MRDQLDTYCWFEGKITLLSEAKVNIQTHALQYATACIGGIRGYWNAEQEQLFLLKIVAHYTRLIRSTKILGLSLEYTVNDLIDITLSILQKSNWESNVYLRPIVYKSSYELTPVMQNVQDEFSLYAIPLNDYLDVNKGLNICISSWVRISDNQIPIRSKASAGYLNSALAKSEAVRHNYDEALFLDIHGNICEGSAENIFLVRDNTLITPDISSSILEGITRNMVIHIAKKMNITIEERKVVRTELYSCEEAFFSGTGVQIAWIKHIDGHTISPSIGPITKQIQDYFFNIVTGANQEYHKWLTPVYS